MKKITKNLLSLMILGLFFIPLVSGAASNLTLNELGAGSDANGIGNNLALGNKSPIATVTSLINTAMIFLGVIAVGIILLAGFKWMTAGGGEEKITEAKKLMAAGVVGIVIILSAWGIAQFILSKAIEVTK